MLSKTILITGAGGFIGAALANRLAEDGHRVRGIDLRYSESNDEPSFDFHTCDFRNADEVEILLSDVDTVLHLASAHLGVGVSDETYRDINVLSLPTFLDRLVRAGVNNLVHFSSVAVYGNLARWPADETTDCEPQSIYGETKLGGEREVTEFSRRTGFPVTILRPAWVYGATCPRTRRLHRSLRKGTFVMVGKGGNLRHPLYIEDLITAVKLAMSRTPVSPEVFVIGGADPLTTRELIDTMCTVLDLKKPRIQIPYTVGMTAATAVELVFRAIGAEPPVSRRTLEFFGTNNAFDISKARETLGFKPLYSVKEGFAHCRHALDSAA